MSDLFLTWETISIEQFEYTYGEDKVTRYVNEILERLMKDFEMDGYSYKFYCETPGSKYNFTFSVNKEWNNIDLLWGAVLQIIDDVMMWFDLSYYGNFNINLRSLNKCLRTTYYELLDWGISYSVSYGYCVHSYVSKEKRKKMKQWYLEKTQKWIEEEARKKELEKTNIINYTFKKIKTLWAEF